MQFAIENNIPLPPQRRAKRAPKYPAKELKPGQSFFVPYGEEDSLRVRTRVRHWLDAHKEELKSGRHIPKFSVRDVPEDGGIRCWRVK